MSQKPRRRPKHLFHCRRLSPAIVAGINALTEDDPSLRPALFEAVAAINNERFLRALALLPVCSQTLLLVAWKDAVFSLKSKPKCDLCPARAKHIRVLLLGEAEYARVVTPRPGQKSFAGFIVVCPSCASLKDAELGRRMVAEHAAVLQRAADAPFRQPVLMGPRIGEAGDLGRRPVLELCHDCGETLWIDQAERDRIAPETCLCLCRGCGAKRFEAGRLQAVPLFELGGLP